MSNNQIMNHLNATNEINVLINSGKPAQSVKSTENFECNSVNSFDNFYEPENVFLSDDLNLLSPAEYRPEYDSDENDDDKVEENIEKIKIGVCAMAKKVLSKPMEQILTRLKSYDHFDINLFDQNIILNSPIEEWPKCDCLISFYSKDFPLKKAEEYVRMFNPFLINDLEKQWDIMDRIKVYQTLKEAGIEQPRYAIKHKNDDNIIEQEDQIEINGQVFVKPFVEKPINADDHNIFIYFPSSAGGGSQRLFRKVLSFNF